MGGVEHTLVQLVVLPSRRTCQFRLDVGFQRLPIVCVASAIQPGRGDEPVLDCSVLLDSFPSPRAFGGSQRACSQECSASRYPFQLSYPLQRLILISQVLPEISGFSFTRPFSAAWPNQLGAFRCAIGQPTEEEREFQCTSTYAWAWLLAYLISFPALFVSFERVFMKTGLLWSMMLQALLPPCIAAFFNYKEIVGPLYYVPFTLIDAGSFLIVFIGVICLFYRKRTQLQAFDEIHMESKLLPNFLSRTSGYNMLLHAEVRSELDLSGFPNEEHSSVQASVSDSAQTAL
eukprot:m.106944 g.106944  ORF g.106944 m.106944 type:complete len:289 (-) comp51685_c0_seq4:142-1008(-)